MPSHSVQILVQIFVMFAAAKLLAMVSERFKVPAVIAEIVAGYFKIPLINENLIRIKDTETQVKLKNWGLREQNLQNAFETNQQKL